MDSEATAEAAAADSEVAEVAELLELAEKGEVAEGVAESDEVATAGGRSAAVLR